jgi:predicted aminopeptidase
MQAFREAQQQEQQLVSLLAAARARLRQLYATALPREAMLPGKTEVFTQLADDIRALERREGGTVPLYEEWIAQGLNNARLASVATYFECVPGFRRLLQQQEGDLPRFYAAARELAKLPHAERHAQLCTAEAAASE